MGGCRHFLIGCGLALATVAFVGIGAYCVAALSEAFPGSELIDES